MNFISCFKKNKKRELNDLSNITELPDVVVFDYDGTINDNKKLFKKVTKYILKKCFTKEERAKIKKEYPKPDILIYDYFEANFSKEKMNETLRINDEFFDKQKIKLMKGVKKLIKHLSNNKFEMLVVSQKCGEGLRKDLEKVKLTKYFKKIYGSLDFGVEIHKPLKEFTDKIIELEHLQNKKLWMIGDTINDVITAQNFRCIALIIDDTSYDIIVERYKDLIGKEIFFTTHKNILEHIKLLNKNR